MTLQSLSRPSADMKIRLLTCLIDERDELIHIIYDVFMHSCEIAVKDLHLNDMKNYTDQTHNMALELEMLP